MSAQHTVPLRHPASLSPLHPLAPIDPTTHISTFPILLAILMDVPIHWHLPRGIMPIRSLGVDKHSFWQVLLTRRLRMLPRDWLRREYTPLVGGRPINKQYYHTSRTENENCIAERRNRQVGVGDMSLSGF